MAEITKKDKMIEFAKKIADEIIKGYPGDGQYLILDLIRHIMIATEYSTRVSS